MKTINVPYYRQAENYSCGPTVLQMIATFYSRPCPMEEIKAATCRSDDRSTSNADLVNAAECLGFKTFSKDNASVSDIQKFVNKGVPVIVNYIETGENMGHFAVVVGADEERIIMNDPEHGANFSMSWTDFAPRWRSGFEKYEKWMMVAEPKSKLATYFDSIFRRKSSKISA